MTACGVQSCLFLPVASSADPPRISDAAAAAAEVAAGLDTSLNASFRVFDDGGAHILQRVASSTITHLHTLSQEATAAGRIQMTRHYYLVYHPLLGTSAT